MAFGAKDVSQRRSCNCREPHSSKDQDEPETDSAQVLQTGGAVFGHHAVEVSHTAGARAVTAQSSPSLHAVLRPPVRKQRLRNTQCLPQGSELARQTRSGSDPVATETTARPRFGSAFERQGPEVKGERLERTGWCCPMDRSTGVMHTNQVSRQEK